MDLLKAMRAFVGVIDEGSFAAASRALDLAPAIVTRLIAQLEQHVGARLINRTTRRLALTEIGTVYLERVRHILASIEDAEALIGSETREPTGMLRTEAPATLLSHQLTRLLPEFRARDPKVALKTLYSAALSGMGIMASPSFVVEEAVVNGSLGRVLGGWACVSYTLYAAVPSRKFLPSCSRVFIDFLTEKFGGQRADPWRALMAAAGVGRHRGVTRRDTELVR